MTIAIIDYGSGNLRSAEKAFERAARAHAHTPDVIVTSDPERVLKADRVVLPGVGAFADCKRGLWAVEGMPEALEQVVRKDGKPFFGICVGMQLMASRGLEFETVEGLGWVEGDVTAMEPADKTLKIPTWAGTPLRSVRKATRFSRGWKRERMACTPISCIRSTLPVPGRKTAWQRSTMPAPSLPWWRRTT